MDHQLLAQMKELTFEEAEGLVNETPLEGFKEVNKGRLDDAMDAELEKLKREWAKVNPEFQHGRSIPRSFELR